MPSSTVTGMFNEPWLASPVDQLLYIYMPVWLVRICISLPVFFRAAAFNKLERYEEAIEDCNDAIEMDPAYSKAYGRKG